MKYYRHRDYHLVPKSTRKEKDKKHKTFLYLLLASGLVITTDFILGITIFHFNWEHRGASLLVYAIVSLLLFPVALWVVSLGCPECFESGRFSANSGFIHMTKTFFYPIVGGLLAMIISEKVNPARMEVRMAITDFEPEPIANVAGQYEMDYILPAVKNLGNFGEVISIKMEKVGRPYDNILDALKNNRIDLAVVSPFTYIFYRKIGNPDFVDSLQVIGFKFPNTGGHQYVSGFVFNREGSSSIRQMLQKADSSEIAYAEASKIRLVLSEEPLSTSGRIVPARWLLERGLSGLVQRADYLPSREMLMLASSDERYFGSLSRDQWETLQKTDPTLAKKLEFYPLEEVPIPFDPLMVNERVWKNKFETGQHLIVDFFLLRNLDLRKTRADIILKALRGIVLPTDRNKKDEWNERNQSFEDYLFTGIVKDSRSIIFPEPYNLLGYSMGYQKCFCPNDSMCYDAVRFSELDSVKRRGDWFSLDYPYHLSHGGHRNALINSSHAFSPGFREVILEHPLTGTLSSKRGALVYIFCEPTFRFVSRHNLPGRKFRPFEDTQWQQLNGNRNAKSKQQGASRSHATN